ncbi:NPCBM/NEW2 domain-containing protein [Kribbella catacumbae]|uniref:NPCBM/NEW2 domain-containing protein n=1 Tax=Kribbella catacumbae TaxID=460086 RepID=UPI000379692D|nr:NPCBM/NEW2 domain-containing protein [Kribbella catacumbae]
MGIYTDAWPLHPRQVRPRQPDLPDRHRSRVAVAGPVLRRLTGVRVLDLVVGDAGDGGYNDRADWAAPTAAC